jgi:two-component system, chemotaxis family, CheB/CheR fusion protein
LKRIFRLLQRQNGTDFQHYRRSTVQRRLARRMALRQASGLLEYTELLTKDAAEVQALAQDFLIRVTSFFRDPLRIWVPGCASGEEAYSIAIVLLEYLGDRVTATRVEIFGTDLSDVAIQKASSCLFTQTESQTKCRPNDCNASSSSSMNIIR